MYCTICGKNMPDDAIVCTSCGSPTEKFYKQKDEKITPKDRIIESKKTIACPRCAVGIPIEAKKCPGCGDKVTYKGGGNFIDGWPGVIALAFFSLGLQQLSDGTLTLAIIFEVISVLFLALRIVIPFVRTRNSIVIKKPFDLQPWMLAYILPLCWTVVFTFDIIRTYL